MALLLDGLCSLPFQQSMAATQLAVRWLLVGLDGLGSLLLGLALDGLGNMPRSEWRPTATAARRSAYIELDCFGSLPLSMALDGLGSLPLRSALDSLGRWPLGTARSTVLMASPSARRSIDSVLPLNSRCCSARG